jgi:hypothetical protein
MASDAAVCRTREGALKVENERIDWGLWLFAGNSFEALAGAEGENLRAWPELKQVQSIQEFTKSEV